MFRSIRWRIAVPFVSLILLLMIILGFYLWNFIRQTYLNELEANFTSEARLASQYLAPILASTQDPATLDPLSKQWSRVLNSRVTIISADGVVLGESSEDRAKMDNHRSRPEILGALSRGQGSSIRYSQTLGYDMMYIAAPVNSGAQTIGFVRIALPLKDIQANLDHITNTLFSATLIATLLAIFLAMWIASRTTLPLHELTEVASQMAQGHLGNRMIPAHDDEVGELTHAFNSMAVQLGSQIEALESERSKMAAVLSQMTDGVVIVNRIGQVELINPAAEDLFEVFQAEAIGHSLAEVLRHHQLVDLWQRAQTTGETQVSTIEISNRRLYLQGVATPLGQALPGSILLLVQNMTRLRRLETVRRDFISNISHELRTPLASLKALTETLQEGALEDPPAARRFLQRMETEVDALSLMISELLELSRIESGRVPLQLESTSPCDLLTAAVDRLRLQAERSGLTISIHCSTETPPVLADPRRMEQVIVNLLHNAIKFTASGGKIDVQTVLTGDYVQFVVRDTGVGIPAKDLERIFERFYKADRARSGGGTGLGLAIARHIIEAHGGKIWAESIEGKGSDFFFTLSLAHL